MIRYEFSNVFVAQSDFGKKKITKKSTHLDHSYLKYTLENLSYQIQKNSKILKCSFFATFLETMKF